MAWSVSKGGSCESSFLGSTPSLQRDQFDFHGTDRRSCKRVWYTDTAFFAAICDRRFRVHQRNFSGAERMLLWVRRIHHAERSGVSSFSTFTGRGNGDGHEHGCSNGLTISLWDVHARMTALSYTIGFQDARRASRPISCRGCVCQTCSTSVRQ